MKQEKQTNERLPHAVRESSFINDHIDKEGEKIVILNFTIGRVLIFDYDSDKYPDAEDFFRELYEKEDIYISESNSDWMIIPSLDEIDYQYLKNGE